MSSAMLIVLLALSCFLHASIVVASINSQTVISGLSSLSSSSSSSLLSSLSSHKHRRHHSSHHHRRRLDVKGTQLIPLYPGFGTHFAYFYVGSPAQRQSLIVDTGDHYTLFPCTDCKNCGAHTDKYWNPSSSNTSSVLKCSSSSNSNSKCLAKEDYSEGSSWEGYEVRDQIYAGDLDPKLMKDDASQLVVDLKFACVQSSTGLFRTQFADGVLGLSNSPDALPYQLKAKGITTTSTFALCFRVGGGVLTLGGMDPRVNMKSVKYAAMRSPLATIAGKNQTDVEGDVAHWYGVTVLKVELLSGNGEKTEIAPDMSSAYNAGKGAIIDSGSTDTFLPKAIATQFRAALNKYTGVDISQGPFSLPTDVGAEKFRKSLPSFVFSLQSSDSSSSTPIEVIIPPGRYLESVGTDKYQLSVYATEPEGMVLGANFISGYNVIFETEKNRIGFAASECNYELLQKNYMIDDGEGSVGPALADKDKEDGSVVQSTDCVKIPMTACSATCDKADKAYQSKGTQEWGNSCDEDHKEPSESRDCFENCRADEVVRGDPECPDEPWSECSVDCIMSKKIVPRTEPTKVGGKCNYKQQTQTCYSGLCPIEDGDFLIYIDLRVEVEADRWSYVYTESFYDAISKVFNLKQHNVELLSDTNNYIGGTKLHFKLRLEAKDYTDITELNNAADKIVESARSSSFGGKLIRALDAISDKYDGKNLSRFGWMYDEDVDVLNAVAIPTVYEEMEDNHEEMEDNLMFSKAGGIAITAVLILAVVLYLHLRLRQEYSLYEKDKVEMSAGRKDLHSIHNKIVAPAVPVVYSHPEHG